MDLCLHSQHSVIAGNWQGWTWEDSYVIYICNGYLCFKELNPILLRAAGTCGIETKPTPCLAFDSLIGCKFLLSFDD